MNVGFFKENESLLGSFRGFGLVKFATSRIGQVHYSTGNFGVVEITTTLSAHGTLTLEG
jgi:hypothetical protein